MRIIKKIIIILIIAFVSYNKFYTKTTPVNKYKNKEIIKLEIKQNKTIYKDNFYYEDINEELKKKITGCSFPNKNKLNNIKIKYSDLKYLKIKHYNFNNEITEGELIVHKEVAQEILEIFYILFLNKYPIEKITLVENYNCIDELSMQDNNTSAFNYRTIEDDEELSWHAFGLAIDINPLYNPYIYGNKIYPSNAEKYTNRTLNIDVYIDHNDLCYQLFKQYGWYWGGDFIYTKDYQHFYKENILDDSIRKIK